MARRKRNSNVLEQADRRIESLQSISVKLDFGEGLTMEAYTIAINDLRSTLGVYNTALSTIDKLTDDVNNAEKIVTALMAAIAASSCGVMANLLLVLKNEVLKKYYNLSNIL